jgi:hypothetical protein
MLLSEKAGRSLKYEDSVSLLPFRFEDKPGRFHGALRCLHGMWPNISLEKRLEPSINIHSQGQKNYEMVIRQTLMS